MKLVLAIFALLALGMTSTLLKSAEISDDSASQNVDTYVAAEIQKEKIPGLALAVIRDGKIIKAQGYGLST